MAYQRAIEDIYWRHRIWSKENTASKPSLAAVMSQAQLEKKVKEYLRNSQALHDYWQQPITPEQLQAEMERMAQHTKQPEVLREIFVALGNDPAVIAECLARPVLAERSVRDLHTEAKLDVSAAKSAVTSPSTMAAVVAVTYRLPVVTGNPTVCFDNWMPTGDPSPAGVSGRIFHKVVWTGSEMIVWGGNDGPAYPSGGKYNPTTDSWSAVSTTNEPVYRDYHTAVWTGTEMIVWGGGPFGNGNTNTGGRYNPTTDTWIATTTTNAPVARNFHTAVWTGTEMIIWGGATDLEYTASGARYNPNTDTWTPTTLPPNEIVGRYGHTAVWTGTEMLVWGGLSQFVGFPLVGGRYNPGTNSWTELGPGPDGRWDHTAVWTGTEMVVWGGDNEGGVLNTGGRYDPITSTWAATTTTNAPDARSYHTAVWTGSEMIVWGGNQFATNTGGRYNPSTDSWTDTTTNNAPEPRFLHTAVWTGSEMIVWGGANTASEVLDSGGRYCGQAGPTPTPTPTATPTATPTPTPTPCTGRCHPTPRPRPTPHRRPTPH